MFSRIIVSTSTAAGSNSGVSACLMLEYKLGNTLSSLARSFLTWFRSLGASKHAGQFSLITGRPASYEKSRSAFSRKYTAGRITVTSPSSMTYLAFIVRIEPLYMVDMRKDSTQSSRCCASTSLLYPSRLQHEYSAPRFIRAQNAQMESPLM